MYIRHGDTHKIIINGEPVHFGKKPQLEFWVEKNRKPGIEYKIVPITTDDIINYCDPFDLEADIYGRYPKNN